MYANWCIKLQARKTCSKHGEAKKKKFFGLCRAFGAIFKCYFLPKILLNAFNYFVLRDRNKRNFGKIKWVWIWQPRSQMQFLAYLKSKLVPKPKAKIREREREGEGGRGREREGEGGRGRERKCKIRTDLHSRMAQWALIFHNINHQTQMDQFSKYFWPIMASK